MNKTFVFDTNVLISSYLLRTSINFKALKMAMKIGSIVSTPETFKEFKNCLLRPKFNSYLTIEKRLYDIAEIESSMKFITVQQNPAICRDPDDDKFLALAFAVDANCLVSGDKDLLILNPYQNIPILTPAQFIFYFNECDDSLIVNEPNAAYGSVKKTKVFVILIKWKGCLT